MENYKAMVEYNKIKNKEKEDRAISEINKMVAENKEVIVCKLVDITGFCRAFFYTNERVHTALKEARKAQCGMEFVRPRKAILEKSLLKEIGILKQRLSEKDNEIAKLNQELQKLRKDKRKSELDFLVKL